MNKRLFNDFSFEYPVPKELLHVPVATNTLKVVATLIDLCEGIDPVITLCFDGINVIDIVNINNWTLVKQQLEAIAKQNWSKSFRSDMNVVGLANTNCPHYNMPTE